VKEKRRLDECALQAEEREKTERDKGKRKRDEGAKPMKQPVDRSEH
jgi:hypothetical protein